MKPRINASAKQLLLVFAVCGEKIFVEGKSLKIETTAKILWSTLNQHKLIIQIRMHLNDFL